VEAWGGERQTPGHDLHRFRIIVDQNGASAIADGRLAGGAAAREEVQHRVAGVGVDADDAVQNAQRLLRGVARALLAIGGDDRVPPHVRRRLAPVGLFRRDQAGGHVRNPVHVLEAEGVTLGVLGVPEDVVVLGRPFPLAAGPVVIRPDDLVHKAVAAEQAVQKDLGVVDLAVVQVQKEAPFGPQQAHGLFEPGLKKGQKVVKVVGEGLRADLHRAIPLPAKAVAIALRVADRLKPRPGLGLARVERWIDVDQVKRRLR